MPDTVIARLLFVCMGNICRSPLAENVFRHKAAQRGVAHRFEIDSAAGERAALSTIARLRGKGRFAQALVETCRLIGEADGHYIVEEQSALVKICRQLGLEPVNAGAFSLAAKV